MFGSILLGLLNSVRLDKQIQKNKGAVDFNKDLQTYVTNTTRHD